MAKGKGTNEYVVRANGELQIYTYNDFIKALKNDEDVMLIGRIDKRYSGYGFKYDGDRFGKHRVSKIEPYEDGKYTKFYLSDLKRLVKRNAQFLANKSVDNFLNNFNEVILNNLRKKN